jgi:hypothetical protein
MSSHHTVVNTTVEGRDEHTEDGDENHLTCCRELRIHPLPHDPLQPQTRAHKPDRNERERGVPRGRPAGLGDAPLVALPHHDARAHCEECLDERAEDEPQARGVSADAGRVPDAADEGAEVEGQERGQSLSVGNVEGEVAEVCGAGEEPRKGEG